MGKPDKLTASQEDYLEVILDLVKEAGAARVRDIAEGMGVAKSSVTGALRTLAKRKLVNYRPYELVTLTGRGERLANGVRLRHEALSDFLTGVLDVDKETAEANACRIEHVVGDIVMEKLNCFLDFMACNAVPANRLSEAFREHCASLSPNGQCNRCQAVAKRATAKASQDKKGTTNE